MPNQSEPDYAHARARASRRAVDWVFPYLAALEANGGSFKRAAKAAKVAYSTVWERRRVDNGFATAEDDAVKRAQRVLESEAVRRAIEGMKVVRFQPRTGKIFYDLQYSDTLLLRLLEKNETGSWRQKHQVEHSAGVTFKTRAERLAALEKARAATANQPTNSSLSELRGSKISLTTNPETPHRTCDRVATAAWRRSDT